MFTFKKWNENVTKGFQLENVVVTKIESKSLIYFNSGVPTLVAVDTAATNEIYILAEDLLTSSAKDNVVGQKNTAVVYEIKDDDLVVAPYKYATSGGTAPTVGTSVSVSTGTELVETGDGEVSRFIIEELLDTSYVSGSNTIKYVVAKKI